MPFDDLELTESPVVRHLREARAELDDSRWNVGLRHTRDGSRCALGFVQYDRTGESKNYTLFQESVKFLAEAALELREGRPHGHNYVRTFSEGVVADFNNTHAGRRIFDGFQSFEEAPAEIKAWFDRAIELANETVVPVEN